jgi:hypothetical protein
MGEKLRYTTYLAGAIESASDSEMKEWRGKVVEYFKPYSYVGIYDPVAREAQKVGKKSGEHVKYIIGLKKAGHYDKFLEEMEKIWFGTISPAGDNYSIFENLRNRKLIDGNELRDMNFWADYESVVRSDFIVAYIKHDVQTVGTIIEIFLAQLFRIPVFLITDVPKTETNSTLLMMVIESGGEIFYNIKDCLDYIKTKYNIK